MSKWIDWTLLIMYYQPHPSLSFYFYLFKINVFSCILLILPIRFLLLMPCILVMNIYIYIYILMALFSYAIKHLNFHTKIQFCRLISCTKKTKRKYKNLEDISSFGLNFYKFCISLEISAQLWGRVLESLIHFPCHWRVNQAIDFKRNHEIDW